MLRKLEVGSLQLLTLSFQTVTQVLNGVSLNQRTSLFALVVDCRGNLASILGVLIANCVNIAIGLTATFLHGELVLHNLVANSGETLQSCVVLSIETLTQTILKTIQFVEDRLIVESISHLSTSQRTVIGIVAPHTVSAKAKHEQEQDYNPEPATLTTITIVIVSSGTDVSKRIVTIHSNTPFIYYQTPTVAHQLVNDYRNHFIKF